MFFLPMGNIHSTNISNELRIAGAISAFLAAVLFIIFFMGLQVSTSLVSSRIPEILGPLPLPKKDISRILLLCLARTFDLPLLVALPLAYVLVGGSPLGGVIAVAAMVTTEVFALALTIGSARFFYSRVATGGGKSHWKTILRSVFMIVWILPSLGSYLVISFAGQIVMLFASFAQAASSSTQFIVLAYPFSFGFLVSSATFFAQTSQTTVVLSAVSSIGYVALAGYSFKHIMRIISRIGGGGIGSTARELVKDTVVKPQRPWLGIIRKDLRIASRSPSYAMLFFLPALQTVVLAISFSSIGEAGLIPTLSILIVVTMITLLLPPTMFSIEGLASTYTRSLPLMRRTLILAKTLLAALIYVVSLISLSIVALYVRMDLAYLLAFGSIHLLSILSASMLELDLLVGKFWREGFALGNLYSRLSTFISILLPAYVLAWIPIVAAFVTYLLAESLVAIVFLGIELSEFAVMSLFVSSKR